MQTVSLACQGRARDLACGTFRLVIILFNSAAFGWVALSAALLNLCGPRSLRLVSDWRRPASARLAHADLSGLAVAL